MLIIIVVFLAAGILLGGSCFWAVIVNCLAACGGIAPFIYARLFKPSVLGHCLLASGLIRLSLAVTGSGVVLYFVKIDVLWFAVWVVVLYLAVLVLEVCFFIRILTGFDEVDKV
jgi:hypothetical protein